MQDKLIFPINKAVDIDNIDATDGMYSEFKEEKNISLTTLKHLLHGKPIVDLSDKEYIHWLQLDDDALKFVAKHFKE